MWSTVEGCRTPHTANPRLPRHPSGVVRRGVESGGAELSSCALHDCKTHAKGTGTNYVMPLLFISIEIGRLIFGGTNML